MENQTQIFGIRAVIEAANAGETIDKAFLQKGLKGELFNELKSLLKSIF
ncbi:MAG: RNA methyltransferase [Flavobacteriaceae bacterium FS1-H7996/R]|nr:MAG: RNA methyltransferase [Flavobacteriaceae bacterium FS1-H7996/R]